MAGDRGGHRHAVPFPERGAALDVGEEEGDGARWQIGHGSFPNVGRLSVCPDCRMTDGQSMSEWGDQLIINLIPVFGTCRTGRAAVYGRRRGGGGSSAGAPWVDPRAASPRRAPRRSRTRPPEPAPGTVLAAAGPGRAARREGDTSNTVVRVTSRGIAVLLQGKTALVTGAD